MGMVQPEFSVIIPVFNKWELTKNCLTSLHEHACGHDFEVIVVDNASSDATAQELAPLGESLFGKRFATIRYEENRNFGPACNAGAKAASGPFLFFLNNDTIVTHNWAAPLLFALRDEPKLGAAGPLLLYANDTVQHLGVAFSPFGVLHLYCDFPRSHRVVGKRRDLQGITGAAIMLDAKLFFECGGFHEEYRNGFEDLELCVRIRQAGKKLTCIPESVVYHLESQSNGRHDNEAHNSELFLRRCGAMAHSDIQIHTARDGFELIVNDLMTLSIALTAAEECKLTLEASGQPAPAWAKLMEENPLWQGGPEYFADICAKQGDYGKELAFRLQLASTYPTLKHYMDVMQLEPYFPKDNPGIYKLKERLGIMQLFRRDRDAAIRRTRTIHKYFPAENPAFFERLFHQKLESLFPQ